jgi:tetratricopeptide (TPR) repeat protein
MRYLNKLFGVLMLVQFFVGSSLFAQSADINRIQSLENKLQLADNDSLRAAICLEQANLFAGEDYIKAADYAMRAVEYSGRTNYLPLKFSALSTAGEIYLNGGQNDIAVDYFIKSIAEAKKHNHQLMVAKAEFNLGSVWMAMGEYEKAEKLMIGLERALKGGMQRLDLNRIDQLALYSNLIMLSTNRRQFEEARDYFHKGLPLAQQYLSDNPLYGQLYHNMADALMEEGRYPEANVMLDTAAMIFRKLGDEVRYANCLVDMALVREKQGDKVGAIQRYKQAYGISEKTGNDYVLLYTSERLHEYYERENQADSTLKYLNIARAIEARLNELETREKLISEELLWQFEEKQAQAGRAYRRKMLSGVAIGFVLLLMIIWLAYQKQGELKQSRLEKYAVELNAEQLRLRNELLEAEIEMKDKQLTTEVMYRIQNNELVRDMVQKLLRINLTSGKESKEAIHSVVRGLEQTLEEKAWEDFEIRFQQVHPGFYEKLQQAYPDLGLNDRRLCAFLKLNMTSKEISAITGQTINSIQVARWRLRKKLGIQESESALANFFSQF